jgi:hypothetical protein
MGRINQRAIFSRERVPWRHRIAGAGAVLATGMAVLVLPLASAAAAAATGWSIQPTPNPAGSPVSLLNGVSCTSATACTAVGGYNNGTAGVTLAEHWSG